MRVHLQVFGVRRSSAWIRWAFAFAIVFTAVPCVCLGNDSATSPTNLPPLPSAASTPGGFVPSVNADDPELESTLLRLRRVLRQPATFDSNAQDVSAASEVSSIGSHRVPSQWQTDRSIHDGAQASSRFLDWHRPIERWQATTQPPLDEEPSFAATAKTVASFVDSAQPESRQPELLQGSSQATAASDGGVDCVAVNDPAAFLDDFSPTPIDWSAGYDDPSREQWPYDEKYDVPTQRPWVEWGRPFYGDGITPPGKNWFGEKNLVRPKLYMYGDYRLGMASGRNAAGRTDNLATRLNLDIDFQLTDTERFHTFIGPLDNGAQFTRWELVDGEVVFRNESDFTPLTGFFEGDLGVMMGAAHNQSSPFELPITFGLIPLLFQNGIWMEDAVSGVAFALPARHSRLLNWSNYDATFFAVFDQINSPAFGRDDHAAQAFGTAWFIEAYGGYIETGYAYVRDRQSGVRSYHNATASFTRRYFDRISNSVRVIVNAGQDLPKSVRTADGVLLLVENSWITAMPLQVVPYANFFAGWNRPQSVARAGVSGGILRNTGINFDTDGLNGLATLDPTGGNTAGGSLGIDLLGRQLGHQLLMEVSYLTPHNGGSSAVPGDQYAVGGRYQIAISNSTLWRFDTMYGWRRGLDDVYGTRIEYRWKF